MYIPDNILICIYIIICYCMSNLWRNYNNHPPKWTYFSLKLAAHHGDDFPGVPSFIPVTSRREVIRWIQWLSLKSELTGGFNLPLWKIWVRQFGFLFPTEWKVIKKHVPVTTNQWDNFWCEQHLYIEGMMGSHHLYMEDSAPTGSEGSPS